MSSKTALGLALSLAASFPSLAPAQADVIVGDLSDVLSYGSVGSTAAFSVGTVSCNVGTADLLWIANTNQHPVIGLAMYKVADGRVGQIGMSWLKHGITALTQSLCGTCNGVCGSRLGVGCSDPYGADLNGSQSGLGPRSEVNAATDSFLYPPQHMPSHPATIGRRIQVNHADLAPALNPGARYFVEGQYVTPDDAIAGNGWNNASYREVRVTPNGGSYDIALLGKTQRTKPAIQAWQDNDSRVVMQTVNMAGDGRLHIGLRAIDLLNGRFRYEYAVHNLNSDRSARRFTVPLPPRLATSESARRRQSPPGRLAACNTRTRPPSYFLAYPRGYARPLRMVPRPAQRDEADRVIARLPGHRVGAVGPSSSSSCRTASSCGSGGRTPARARQHRQEVHGDCDAPRPETRPKRAHTGFAEGWENHWSTSSEARAGDAIPEKGERFHRHVALTLRMSHSTFHAAQARGYHAL